MPPSYPTSPLEAKARALRLSQGFLLDASLESISEELALRVRLLRVGARDETLAGRVAQRVLAGNDPFVVELEWLCRAMSCFTSGLPVLRQGALPRELARLADPDALFLFHPDLELAADDRFDWAALPLPAGGRTAGLLRDGSLDTHIHLGGSLATGFYWIPLMGGGLHLDSLRGLPRTERRNADASRWQREVARGAWHRIQLARLLEERTGRRMFPWLDPIVLEAWGQEKQALSPDRMMRRILQMAREVHPVASRQGGWAFPDPLRPPETERQRPHYGVGERRLLYGLARYLWDIQRKRRPRDYEVEDLLREYLRLRNAFHTMLTHDLGAEGLLRFVETFGRRGFVFDVGSVPGRRRGRQRGRRRRGREMILALERERMTAALDAQLVGPYDTVDCGPSSSTPHRPRPPGFEVPRRLEMRVSVPLLRDLPRTLGAWLDGIARHLVVDTEDEPRVLPSQVGLLFHCIKTQSGMLGAEEARRNVERLIYALEKYPALRPFLVGVDAAGFERSSNPRTFLNAFQHLRTWLHRFRPTAGDPGVRLGWTFHVGEDVEDFLTGLRHVDEAASLLLPRLREGGRLGHCLVLGDDPIRFYTRRGMTEPTLGIHLLDLIWAWGRLRDEAVDNGLTGWIEQRILRFGRVTKKHAVDCYQAMALDTPDASTAFLDEELLAELDLGDLDPSLPYPLQADPTWFEILVKVQEILRRRIAAARICIEANPTSNLLIGGYTHYGELPYGPLVDADIALSVNTDDPGLFLTTLPGELEILYESMEALGGHRNRLTWLRDRIFDAEQSTFLHHVPLGEAALEGCRAALERIARPKCEA